MTTTPNDTVEVSGRELDAAVHERVFGKCVHNYRPNHSQAGSWSCTECKDWRNEIGELEEPGYYQSWTGAGMVIEAMEAKGFAASMASHGNWLVTFCNGYEEGEAQGDTLPEATCRAALLALSALSGTGGGGKG